MSQTNATFKEFKAQKPLHLGKYFFIFYRDKIDIFGG